MSFTADLFSGMAQLLAANCSLTYNPTGTYQPSDVGLYDEMLPTTPDKGVAISFYPLSDDPTLSDSELGMQLRSRAGADPRAVKALDDATADYLLGNYPLTIPTGIRISTLVRSSGVSLGRDDLNRWERVSNYTLLTHRPSTNRT